MRSYLKKQGVEGWGYRSVLGLWAQFPVLEEQEEAHTFSCCFSWGGGGMPAVASTPMSPWLLTIDFFLLFGVWAASAGPFRNPCSLSGLTALAGPFILLAHRERVRRVKCWRLWGPIAAPHCPLARTCLGSHKAAGKCCLLLLQKKKPVQGAAGCV